MRFMQTESVLQTKNRSRPAKNRFSVALLLMQFATFVAWDITHRGCYSRHLSLLWVHANNDAREIDEFIGYEGDFPI